MGAIEEEERGDAEVGVADKVGCVDGGSFYEGVNRRAPVTVSHQKRRASREPETYPSEAGQVVAKAVSHCLRKAKLDRTGRRGREAGLRE